MVVPVATYIDYASVVCKGVEQEYGNTLGLLKVIHLSSNNLTGEIPGELTSLIELITLNLSRNMLSEIIPKEIGQLKALESLNLSANQLSGLCVLPLNTTRPGHEKEADGTENNNLEDEKWYKTSGFRGWIHSRPLGHLRSSYVQLACETCLDRLCMTIALNAARALRRLES
ncbi:hypothetical protein PTKIN_Ptkin12aG0104400 [Pterospermum kingtungense]